MKRIARVSLLVPVIAFVFTAASCGGGNTTPTPTGSQSKLKKRAIVANNSGNIIQIIDATKDEATAFLFGAASVTPKFLVPGGSGKTVVYYSSSNSVSTTDNTTEQAAQINSAVLPAAADDLVASSDGKAAYAVLHSAGVVSVIDLTSTTSFTVSASIPVPSVRRIVLSHNGSKLLAFSDGIDTITLVNTSDKTTTTIAGFDRPVYGVFSSDDSKAYILSCGAECGGTQAKVTVLDIASATPGASVNVPAASVGVLDGSSLYVAGSLLSGTAPLGRLTALDPGTLAISKTINIGDGFHTVISVPSSGKVVVGARTCTTGCTSIVDVGGGSASISSLTGDTLSIAPITGRSVVYVIEGNELVIYDLTTGKPQAKQVDIIGTPTSVLYIGPQ